ncbi:ABC transporter ATP-binding protein [uncultured Cohaesibacter sp.]|uniref:ABC transporter ATP-binding protein n=1 Tax=uncultured Cohaesibacter sp. TaxID=1002546 RepID=UPI0029C6B09D|nr:ABC transporter ATP-binding protein [uncultured Cohaesibacter sp.]
MADKAAREAETVLRLSGITKRFGPLVANDAITFELKKGEVIALLGENGAGKTTLMNILFGHYVADEGTVELFGQPLPPGEPSAALEAGVGMVHQHFTLTDNLSVLDNIALGTQSLWSWKFDRKAARERITKLSQDFGLTVDPNAMVSELTVGERQRVEILKALYRDARILILDEPTAVLTPLETDALFKTLKMLIAQGMSVIFISHKLHEVVEISDRVLVLRSGKLTGERKTGETDRHELAALMVGEEIKVPEVEPVTPGKAVLELIKVSTSREGTATPLRDIDLVLREGEITGLAGVSGNGQVALAALLSGMISQESGDMLLNGREVGRWSPRQALRMGVGRIPEDRHAMGAIGDMSVMENAISENYRNKPFSSAGWLDWKSARQSTEQAIVDYDVKCPSPDARIRLLSGGNMQKLILARALGDDPKLIIAAQPTRGLDVGAVTYVHNRLLEARKRGAAILLISEDLDEIRTLSDRIVVISEGQLSSPSARGERSVQELGVLMAGHKDNTAGASDAA